MPTSQAINFLTHLIAERTPGTSVQWRTGTYRRILTESDEVRFSRTLSEHLDETQRNAPSIVRAIFTPTL